ncbi:cytochrome C [Mucilaginibacter sp.]|uniref:c-type cytochrome n=1 Tax=Mucilaginibacter sp. TaxID=1882438 RepID=UPI0028467517|nr:cytochrome C [Mucilaginibacter sp.]MDR3697845.1 cytochrome C [Mucilaginibacter sp.]
MKKFKKALLYAVIFVVLAVVSVVSYVTLALPDVGKPENITVALTPQRIARGQYLANHVCLCIDCHSQRDWSKPIGDIPPGHFGSGGDDIDISEGVPGDIYIPNITPYKLRSWTDGEIFRAITAGERKDGSAIFPLMPWPHFSKMDREDLYAIIAYLRSLPAIKTNPYPKPKLDFPTNIFVHTMPTRAIFGKLPDNSDTAKYGEYLTLMADCDLCHSRKENGKMFGKIIPGLNFAGGVEFQMGNKKIYSANLTPEKQTGIGAWTREAFVERFKSFTDSARLKNKSSKNEASPMPWYDYSGMSETDLKAIYFYLRTIKPVYNKTFNN